MRKPTTNRKEANMTRKSDLTPAVRNQFPAWTNLANAIHRDGWKIVRPTDTNRAWTLVDKSGELNQIVGEFRTLRAAKRYADTVDLTDEQRSVLREVNALDGAYHPIGDERVIVEYLVIQGLVEPCGTTGSNAYVPVGAEPIQVTAYDVTADGRDAAYA